MWICSTLGFFSIVKKDDGYFHVRARVPEDLVNLREAANMQGVAIDVWPDADYRFRIRVNSNELDSIFWTLFKSIEYPNFKDAIAARATQRPKLPAYSQLWSNLAKLQLLCALCASLAPSV